MEIREEKYSDILIEIIDFDRATIGEANLLKEKINKSIAEGWIKIIIDLSTCEYVDSTFLGVLVMSLKKATKLGGDVRLVGLRSEVLAMFELTRMFRVFRTYSDIPNAIDGFTQHN
jgi:anti-anti-sigma factor